LGNDFEEQLAVTEYPEAGLTRSASVLTDAAPELIENCIGMKFTLIPSGEFTMGIPDQGNDSDLPAECPAHQVRITRPFYFGIYEVTQAHYAAVMSENPSWHIHETDDRSMFPVENVTWDEAAQFCKSLSERDEERSSGRKYRLPTEAEWEYACRDGRSEAYVWRGKRHEKDGSGENAGFLPPLPLTSVGSYPPNHFGLHDMRGNVWEWTADWFDRDYYARSPVDDPQGPSFGYLKVVRGGDWTFVGETCRINYPMTPPSKGSRFIGFRVVCEVVSRAEPN